MRGFQRRSLLAVAIGLLAAFLTQQPWGPALAGAQAAAPAGTLVGVEYAMPGLASAFIPTGAQVAKVYSEHVEWGRMQKAPGAALDFAPLDRFVHEYQDAGFRHLMVALKPFAAWGVRNVLFDYTPRPEQAAAHAAWVQGVVERYDGDGMSDMPGLRFPVRLYEIGTEFSSYEPGPARDYVATLRRAADAARRADPSVQIFHAAFMPAEVFTRPTPPERYDAAFSEAERRHTFLRHGLKDMRLVLDHPEAFDGVNFHALGNPPEIEEIVAWLKWEMKRRNYTRPITISDTMPNPLIGWGPATRGAGDRGPKGTITAPAVEADRDRLTAFFRKLVAGDGPTVDWARRFCAADMVQKVTIATEQGVALINTSFMEDLAWLKLPPAQAGAGVSAWGGMVTATGRRDEQRTVTGTLPPFHAVRQLLSYLKDATGVERLRQPDPRARVYRLHSAVGVRYIAWLTPERLVLPGDPIPSVTVRLPAKGPASLLPMATRPGPESGTPLAVESGQVTVHLQPAPLYVAAQ